MKQKSKAGSGSGRSGHGWRPHTNCPHPRRGEKGGLARRGWASSCPSSAREMGFSIVVTAPLPKLGIGGRACDLSLPENRALPALGPPAVPGRQACPGGTRCHEGLLLVRDFTKIELFPRPSLRCDYYYSMAVLRMAIGKLCSLPLSLELGCWDFFLPFLFVCFVWCCFVVAVFSHSSTFSKIHPLIFFPFFGSFSPLPARLPPPFYPIDSALTGKQKTKQASSL